MVEFHEASTSPAIAHYKVTENQIEEHLFFSDGKRRNFADRVESYAQFLYLQDREGKLKRVSAVGATFCRVDGKVIMNEKKRKNVEREY